MTSDEMRECPCGDPESCTEAVPGYRCKAGRTIWQGGPRDEKIAMLREALMRTVMGYRLLLARKPVRDAKETLTEANRALAATAQPEQDGGWLPMESAPTDCTEIEAWHIDAGCVMTVSRYVGPVIEEKFWTVVGGNYQYEQDRFAGWRPKSATPTRTEAEGG